MDDRAQADAADGAEAGSKGRAHEQRACNRCDEGEAPDAHREPDGKAPPRMDACSDRLDELGRRRRPLCSQRMLEVEGTTPVLPDVQPVFHGAPCAVAGMKLRA